MIISVSTNQEHHFVGRKELGVTLHLEQWLLQLCSWREGRDPFWDSAEENSCHSNHMHIDWSRVRRTASSQPPSKRTLSVQGVTCRFEMSCVDQAETGQTKPIEKSGSRGAFLCTVTAWHSGHLAGNNELKSWPETNSDSECRWSNKTNRLLSLSFYSNNYRSEL